MNLIRGVALLLVPACLFFPLLSGGRVLVMPNGERAPGELGGMMAGAQVAVSSGAEAAWYNPAGMAKESRTVLAAGGVGLETENVSIRDLEGSTARGSPGFFSLMSSSAERGREHRFSYGIFLARPLLNRFLTRLETGETVGQDALPEALVGPADLDALFPGGIAREESSRGVGELSVYSPGIAMGFAAIPWFRVGASLRLERVHLEERSETLTLFSASGAEGSGDFLSGSTQTTAYFQGDASRLIPILGFQADLARWFSAGLTIRFPSEDERGTGRVFFARGRALSVSRGNQVLVDSGDFVFVERNQAGFSLRTPRETRFGLALLFDALTLELDWIRSEKLASYEVFPAQESSSAVGSPYQTPALRTSLNPSNRFALGIALSLGGKSSVLFGFSQDTSGVPADDPVFRKVDFNTASGGVYFVRDTFSISVGLIYRVAEEHAVFPPLLGEGESIRKKLTISAFGLALGFSFIL